MIILKKTFSILFIFIILTLFVSYVSVSSSFALASVGSWTHIGLNNLVVSTLVSDPTTSNILYAGTNDGVYKSIDGGNSWLPTSNQGTAASIVVISSSTHNTLYATLGATGIQKSTDAGNTWTNVTNNFGTPIVILDLAVDPNTANTVYAASYGNCLGVRKTTNGGTTWNGIGGGCDIFRIIFDPVNPTTMYVGGTNFSGYFEKSTDGGNSWIVLNQGLASPGAVHGIVIDAQKPNTIYAGDENFGVYKTIDDGNTWNLLSNSPQVQIFNALAIHPVDSSIYAKSTNGVAKSTDGGSTWTAINDGDTPLQIEKLIILPNDPYDLYAATDNGLYVYGLQAKSTSLDVPLFKQGVAPYTDNNPSWESDLFGIGTYGCGTTIAQCGCAMTSDAMIFKYYHIDKLPNGTDLTPGTLNSWLKANKGYFRDEGVNPYISATIAKKAKSLNPNFTYDGLEYSYIPGVNKNQLTTDLNNGIPDVLEEPGHFIVGKGIDGNSFNINDPFYNRTNLTSYNNSFLSLGRFVPTNTNMSYIIFAVDKDVTISVTDSLGNPVGKSHVQYHINNPETPPSTLNSSLIIFDYPKPANGLYAIQLSSATAQTYQLDEYLITQNGDYTTDTMKGFFAPNITVNFSLNYDNQSTTNSTIKPTVTFDQLISDIQTLYNQSQITNYGTYTSLLNEAKAAKKSSIIPLIGKPIARVLLNTMQTQITKLHGTFVKEQGYQILAYEITTLIKAFPGN